MTANAANVNQVSRGVVATQQRRARPPRLAWHWAPLSGPCPRRQKLDLPERLAQGKDLGAVLDSKARACACQAAVRCRQALLKRLRDGDWQAQATYQSLAVLRGTFEQRP